MGPSAPKFSRGGVKISLFIAFFLTNIFGQGGGVPPPCAPPNGIYDFDNECIVLRNVQVKSEKIVKEAEKQGKLTSVIRQSLLQARSNEELDLLAAPFKTAGKQTLAARAKALGLEDVALQILKGEPNPNFRGLVDKKTKGLETIEDVEKGLIHIMSDAIVHDAKTMHRIGELQKESHIVIESSERKNDCQEASKYQNYFKFSCPAKYLKPHQVLALNRGESVKVLTVKVVLPDSLFSKFQFYCKKNFANANAKNGRLFSSSIDDRFKRLGKCIKALNSSIYPFFYSSTSYSTKDSFRIDENV